jgi:gamma-glutamylcyclotransferase (GGCT)/AIG2-like uncharacterized protein YtfP
MTECGPEHLFVYGTLMRRGKSPYAGLLRRRAEFVGEAWVAGRLYHLGRFPGAVPVRDCNAKVYGEVFRLTAPSVLDALDRYEGCHPADPEHGLFRRETAEAQLAGRSRIAVWIYAFAGSLAGRPLIASGRFPLA